MLHHVFIFDQSYTLKVLMEPKGNLLGDRKMGGRVEGREVGNDCVAERVLCWNRKKIQVLKALALKY